jgi:hypothetical protein
MSIKRPAHQSMARVVPNRGNKNIIVCSKPLRQPQPTLSFDPANPYYHNLYLRCDTSPMQLDSFTTDTIFTIEYYIEGDQDSRYQEWGGIAFGDPVPVNVVKTTDAAVMLQRFNTEIRNVFPLFPRNRWFELGYYIGGQDTGQLYNISVDGVIVASSNWSTTLPFVAEGFTVWGWILGNDIAPKCYVRNAKYFLYDSGTSPSPIQYGGWLLNEGNGNVLNNYINPSITGSVINGDYEWILF